MSAPKPRLDVDATRDRLLALGCGYAAERLGELLGEAVRAEIAPRTSSPTRRGRSPPTAVIPVWGLQDGGDGVVRDPAVGRQLPVRSARPSRPAIPSQR